jgi:hypothetical protein
MMMKITYAPNNYSATGVVAFASWENKELQAAIRLAFRESPQEDIVEIIIERDGIKAVFETRASCVK